MKIVRKITKEVGYNTDECFDIKNVEIEFTQEKLDTIKAHQEYLRVSQAFKITILSYDIQLLDSDGEVNEEFRSDGGEIFIFPHCIYLNVVSKHDSSAVVESAEITNSELY
jgi:hypothetical protein